MCKSFFINYYVHLLHLLFYLYTFVYIFNTHYFKFNKMKDIKIPKQATKVKRLILPVTLAEHENVMKYCNEKKVNVTDLIRFAIKETYELL